MKKYLGKKWKQLTQEQKDETLSKIEGCVNVDGNTVIIGKCIIDFSENISIGGKLIKVGDSIELEIDDDAIFYNPEEGVILENEKFKDLISLKDAAILFGRDESTLRRNIKNGLFKEWEDCIKFGKQWVFDIKALERVYK